MNESELIKAAQQGDTEALARLLHQHYLFVLKYLFKVTLNKSRAEDLTQDTMMRAIEKIRLYDEQRSRFSTWLMTIATRLYLDERRKRKRETAWLTMEAACQTVTRSLRWQMEQTSGTWPELLDTLAALPRDTRTAIILKYYYGYAYDEIANIMKIPAGTVKSRIHNGLKAIREE